MRVLVLSSFEGLVERVEGILSRWDTNARSSE
jgi:hypothetical protein